MLVPFDTSNLSLVDIFDFVVPPDFGLQESSIQLKIISITSVPLIDIILFIILCVIPKGGY
jgi:hypothetical protein